MTDPSTTVVIVAFGVTALDVSWIPPAVRVVVVHNDDLLSPAAVDHPRVEHVSLGRNLGFGAAVDHVVDSIDTDRLLLVNPDTALTADHWAALASARPHEVMTIPLLDDHGKATAVASAYPTPLAHLLTGYRVGRLAGRGSRLRTMATKALGGFGRAHTAALSGATGRWPLSERWISGAVISIPTERFRAVGGFDPDYFLYYEDADLCARLAARAPAVMAVVADVSGATHTVGGSAAPTRSLASASERHRLDSAITYATRRPGVWWRATEQALRLRRRLGPRRR